MLLYHGYNGNGTSTCKYNFGNPNFTISSGNSDANGYGNFEYSVPANYYYALNTKKFSGIWIMAYTTIDKPTDYFNTKLYTGTGSSPKSFTGVGFRPDWVWAKQRNEQNHTT